MKITKRLRKLGLLMTLISISPYTVLASSSLPPISSTLPSEMSSNKNTEVTNYNPSIVNELSSSTKFIYFARNRC